MTILLLKKQLAESFSFLLLNKKSGKTRSRKGLLLAAGLLVALFAYVAVFIYILAREVCAPLYEIGLGWFYVAIAALLSIVLGVVGSIFSTYQSLYRAKDNDLLLAMPIKPRSILTARLVTVYAIGFLYALPVYAPAMAVYLSVARPGALGVIFTILAPFILGLFILTLACLLGFALAYLNSKFKINSIVSVVLILIFIAAYYYLLYNAQDMFMKILSDPAGVSKAAKGVLYPLYHMGLATTGDALSMLIFTAIFAALFALTYLLLSLSFLKLATANVGTRKKVYREKKQSAAPIGKALLFKEWKRFSSCTIYFMNAGLSSFILPILAIVLLVKGTWVTDTLGMLLPQLSRDVMIPFVLVATVMVAGMNAITAPSISLEGKHLWILRTCPVGAREVFAAKVRLHLLFTVPPTLLFVLAVLIVLKPCVWCWILLPLACAAYVALVALLGLALNLKFPNLTYTSEAQPVKQSLPTFLVLFGGWGYSIAVAVIYYLTMDHITPALYLGIVTAATLLLTALCGIWISKRGTKLFEEL